MPLLIKGKRPPQPERVDLFPGENLVVQRPSLETVSAWCHDNASKAIWSLLGLAELLRRTRFLDAQLRREDLFDHPERHFAGLRRDRYIDLARGRISEAIYQEWCGDAIWRYLTPEQRERSGLHVSWSCAPDRPDLVGVVCEWERFRTAVGGDFDVKAFMGPQNILVLVEPYREDIKHYVDRGWLQPPDQVDRYAKARQNAQRNMAIAGRTKDRIYGNETTRACVEH